MARRVQSANPFDFTSCLAQELRAQNDKRLRLPLLFGLYRALESSPKKQEEAFELLDEMVRLAPDDPDVVREAWRASSVREPEKRLAALSALTEILEYPSDIIHAHLFSAEILSEELGETARAVKKIDAVKKTAPNKKEVLLASARLLLYLEDAADRLDDLEKFANLLSDTTVRATLLFEISRLKQKQGAAPDVVSRLSARALLLPDADWAVVDGVLRSAEKNNDFRLCEAAVERTAEVALRTDAEPVVDKTTGRNFDGFVRSQSEAGALFWYLAQIREQHLKDRKTALTALEKAQSALPKDRLIKLERARLLSALGRHDDAFAAVPEDAAFCELSVFAAAAGKYEEAAYLASLERESARSFFAEILADALCDRSAPPPKDAEPWILQNWFENHPDHPDALLTAKALRPFVDHRSTAALYLEENEPDERLFPDTGDRLRPEPWTHALKAISKDEAGRAESFERWARTVTDAALKSTLLRAALMQREKDGVSTHRLESLKEKIQSADREITDADATFEPSAENWRAALNAEAKNDDASKEDRAEIDRFKRALILSCALEDADAAIPLLEALKIEHPDDPFLSFLLMDAACRTSNFEMLSDRLDDLMRQAPEDAAEMLLCAGELLLLLNKDLKNALKLFDAAETADEKTAGTARVHRLLTLHLLNEEDEILRAVEDAPSSASPQAEPDDFFDFQDDPDDGFEAAALLEDKDGLPVYSKLLELLSSPIGASPDGAGLDLAAERLVQLADLLPKTEHADAFVAAAALLAPNGQGRKMSAEQMDPADRQLCLLFDKTEDAPNDETTARLLTLAEKVRASDLPEWIDRMLSAADAAAKARGPEKALEIIHEALDVSPEHPGLLEAELGFALASGAYEEAADTRKRLARFYISQDEKVHQLAQAALISLDKLQDPRAARDILDEIREKNPDRAEADELLRHLFRAVGENGNPDDASAADRKTKEEQKLFLESEEKRIADLAAADRREEAMEAVSRLLMRFPDRPSVHRARLDLLTRSQRWEEAVAAAEAYFNAATNREERRSVVFRAATIAENVLKDPRLAIAWLNRLQEVGDLYEEARRRIRAVAQKADIEIQEEDSAEGDENRPSAFTAKERQ